MQLFLFTVLPFLLHFAQGKILIDNQKRSIVNFITTCRPNSTFYLYTGYTHTIQYDQLIYLRSNRKLLRRCLFNYRLMENWIFPGYSQKKHIVLSIRVKNFVLTLRNSASRIEIRPRNTREKFGAVNYKTPRNITFRTTIADPIDFLVLNDASLKSFAVELELYEKTGHDLRKLTKTEPQLLQLKNRTPRRDISDSFIKARDAYSLNAPRILYDRETSPQCKRSFVSHRIVYASETFRISFLPQLSSPAFFTRAEFSGWKSVFPGACNLEFSSPSQIKKSDRLSKIYVLLIRVQAKLVGKEELIIGCRNHRSRTTLLTLTSSTKMSNFIVTIPASKNLTIQYSNPDGTGIIKRHEHLYLRRNFLLQVSLRLNVSGVDIFTPYKDGISIPEDTKRAGNIFKRPRDWQPKAYTPSIMTRALSCQSSADSAYRLSIYTKQVIKRGVYYPNFDVSNPCYQSFKVAPSRLAYNENLKYYALFFVITRFERKDGEKAPNGLKVKMLFDDKWQNIPQNSFLGDTLPFAVVSDLIGPTSKADMYFQVKIDNPTNIKELEYEVSIKSHERLVYSNIAKPSVIDNTEYLGFPRENKRCKSLLEEPFRLYAHERFTIASSVKTNEPISRCRFRLDSPLSAALNGDEDDKMFDNVFFVFSLRFGGLPGDRDFKWRIVIYNDTEPEVPENQKLYLNGTSISRLEAVAPSKEKPEIVFPIPARYTSLIIDIFNEDLEAMSFVLSAELKVNVFGKFDYFPKSVNKSILERPPVLIVEPYHPFVSIWIVICVVILFVVIAGVVFVYNRFRQTIESVIRPAFVFNRQHSVRSNHPLI